MWNFRPRSTPAAKIVKNVPHFSAENIPPKNVELSPPLYSRSKNCQKCSTFFGGIPPKNVGIF
jgi:hypothetical protein